MAEFRFRDNIRKNYSFLNSNLKNHNQVAIAMFNEELISFAKKDKIMSILTNFEKSEEILSNMLVGTTEEDYSKFLKILKDTENRVCLEVLEKAGNAKISERMARFEREEREVLKGDFRVQNHHSVKIALALCEVQGLPRNWNLICNEILTPRSISNIENEQNFETKIMQTIQAWITRMGRDASYNLLINKIKPINGPAADVLEDIREDICGFSSN